MALASALQVICGQKMTEGTRIGFIGAGGIARSHADALATVDGCQIVAITDIQTEAAEALAAKTGAAVFDSPESLARDGGVDVLFILVPPFAHGAPERTALKHGIPFFVEKPIALEEGFMNEISQEVERQGLLTSVGYMNRYRKGVQRVREVLVGEPPILAYGGWWGGSPGHHPWWTNKSKSGGQFHEQTTHTVDLARYLFGEPSEVFAVAANGYNKGIEGYSMDDAVTVAIRFKNGGIANLMSSLSSNAGGGIFLKLHTLNHNIGFTGWEHSVSIKAKEGEPEEIAGEPNVFALEDAAFLQAIRDNDPSKILSTYSDGAKSAALSLAANKSLETGKPVEL
jgi:myo-inositol 2-dehydrogenase/D-chiro-inositol 1-dehydrogenase